MKFAYALLLFVASAVVVFAATTYDDDEDHSKHCHIEGYPTIHVNFGEYIDLPGACIKLLCKTTDLFEAVNTCETVPNSPENVDFANRLLKGKMCPKN